MDAVGYAITAGLLAALLLEGIKWVIRLVMKNPTYDFPAWFYTLALAVLTFLLSPVADWVNTGVWQWPFGGDWVTWLIELVKVIIGVVTGFIGYNTGIKPLKEYRRALKA